MATIKKFEDLEIWQKARSFAKAIWERTSKGTFARDFGLRNQINNSSGSIMDNIAEGFEREGKQEFLQFLSISKSSAAEARSQLYRAFDRGHLVEEDLKFLIEEATSIGNMLGGFMKYLRECQIRGLKYKTSEVSDIEIEDLNNFRSESEI